jgi:hypothetical protein
MKDYLSDLVAHTQGLGSIGFVKITGNTKDTKIEAVSEDKAIILQGAFNAPIAEFIGVFGMPDLNKLNIILNISEYEEDAVISVTKKTVGTDEVPSGLHFQNKAGDFENIYRFMTTDVVNEKLKFIKLKNTPKWNITFNPSVASIQRFKFQSQAHSEEPLFTAKTEKKNLVFQLGDVSSHAGNFVFENNFTGSISKPWSYPVQSVLSIMGLLGDKTMMFSDEGLLQITVDSGIAKYNYMLPPHTK